MTEKDWGSPRLPPRKPQKPGNPTGINQWTKKREEEVTKQEKEVKKPPLSVDAPLEEETPPLPAQKPLPNLSERLAYTVAEAAQLCGISERQMRRLVADGKIHAADMGDLRIGKIELERYLMGTPRFVADSVAAPEPVPVRRSPLKPTTSRRS